MIHAKIIVHPCIVCFPPIRFHSQLDTGKPIHISLANLRHHSFQKNSMFVMSRWRLISRTCLVIDYIVTSSPNQIWNRNISLKGRKLYCRLDPLSKYAPMSSLMKSEKTEPTPAPLKFQRIESKLAKSVKWTPRLVRGAKMKERILKDYSDKYSGSCKHHIVTIKHWTCHVPNLFTNSISSGQITQYEAKK